MKAVQKSPLISTHFSFFKSRERLIKQALKIACSILKIGSWSCLCTFCGYNLEERIAMFFQIENLDHFTGHIILCICVMKGHWKSSCTSNSIMVFGKWKYHCWGTRIKLYKTNFIDIPLLCFEQMNSHQVSWRGVCIKSIITLERSTHWASVYDKSEG